MDRQAVQLFETDGPRIKSLKSRRLSDCALRRQRCSALEAEEGFADGGGVEFLDVGVVVVVGGGDNPKH